MPDTFFTQYPGHASAEIIVTSSQQLADAIGELESGTGGTIRLDPTGSPYQLDAFGIGAQETPILITSLDPATPAEMDLLNIRSASYLTFDQLSFVNTRDTPDYALSDFTIRVTSSDHIEFTSNLMTGSASETAEDDTNNGGSLANVKDSAHIAFIDNEISRYFHGPTIVNSQSVDLIGNEISQMQGDGIRGGGLTDVTISHNLFTDFFGAVQTVTHNDMIQLWGRNVASENRDIIIDSNIMNANDGEATQGIFIRNETFGQGGAASGYFDNIQITNNLLYNGRPQGIAIRDTRDALVQNNSVLWNTDSSHQDTNTSPAESFPPAILGTNLIDPEVTHNIAVQISVNSELLHNDNYAVNYDNPNAFEFVGFHIVDPDQGAGATLDDLMVLRGSPFVDFGFDPEDLTVGGPPRVINAQFGTDDATSYRLNGTSHIDYDEAPIAISGVESLEVELGFKMDQTPDADGHVLRLPGLMGMNVYDHGGFVFRLVTEDGAFQVSAPPGTLSDGEYHDIRVDYDAAAGMLSLLVDQVVVGEVAASGATVDASNQDVILGQSFGSSAEGYIQYFTVAVPQSNAAPVATDDDLTGAANNPLTGQLEASDADGDPLGFMLSAEPENGTVIVMGDGSFTYSPDEDFGGSDSFGYVVSDGNGGSDTGLVTLNVILDNMAPVFSSQAMLSILENRAALPDIVATDPEEDAVSYAITGGPDAALFELDAQTGALSFLSAPNFDAPADADADNIYQFTVTASDGLDAAEQEVAVSVQDDPDFPSGDTLDVFIFNKSTDEMIIKINDGDVVDAALLENVDITIVAFLADGAPVADEVNSIKINFQDGQVNRTETVAPYALFGDDANGNYFGGIELDEGIYDIGFDLFSEARGQGSLLEEVDITFSVAAAEQTLPLEDQLDTTPTDVDAFLFAT